VKALNLFGGPGGFCEAARSVGIEVLGVEHDPVTCSTRMAADHPTVGADVAALDPAWFAGADGLIASPPCPPWSRAGKRLGVLDQELVYDATRDLAVGYERSGRRRLCHDERSILVTEPWRWVLALRPRWVALEQVEDVLAYWRFLADGLGAVGYSTWAGVLNAADYGTPQTRRRAILIASLDRRVGRPETTHMDPRKGLPMFYEPWVSMGEALGWDGHVTATGNTKGGTRPDGLDRSTREPAFALTSRADQLRKPARTVCGHRAPRWAYDRPSPTLTTTVQGTPRIGRPGHKNRDAGESQFAHGAVPVSLEEAAVLQDFPPDYPFQGSKTQRFAQVGNAVPIRLARAVLTEAAGLNPEVAA
jgi:DNA (cytosine-5)-methyltransferase 1